MKLAVVSGKGGSGKSSVSAALIAQADNVVAVDCDVDASNLPLLFPHETVQHVAFASGQEVKVDVEACVGCGICVEKCAFHALQLSDKGIVQTQDFLCEGCGLCVRLCPQHALRLVAEENSDIQISRFRKGIMVHGNLHPGDDNSGKMIAHMRTIADRLMEEEGSNLQILDGPPGIGCPVLSTLTGVDRVLIVVEPTLSGISDLQRIYKVASSYSQDISVLINKSNINAENCVAIVNFCKEKGLSIVGELPFDRRWVESQLHCESILTYAPDSAGAQTMRKVYEQLCLR